MSENSTLVRRLRLSNDDFAIVARNVSGGTDVCACVS